MHYACLKRRGGKERQKYTRNKCGGRNFFLAGGSWRRRRERESIYKKKPPVFFSSKISLSFFGQRNKRVRLVKEFFFDGGATGGDAERGGAKKNLLGFWGHFDIHMCLE